MNDQTRFRTLHLGLLFASLSLITAACASSGVGQDAPTATAPAAIIAAENTPTSPPPTATAPQPTATSTTAPPTATSTTTPPTATPAPAPTLPPRVANTLLLYTTAVADPSGQAYWAFRTLPPLSQLDPAGFDTLYGPYDSLADFSMLFADLSPQLSPDGQTLLVPGLAGYAEQGIAGTGTWLVDRATGATRQLLPRGVSATWSPGSDAITYVEGTTLYTLSTAAGATPQPLFEDPNLWNLYAKWSPDGQWIAAVSGIQHWPTEETEPTLTFTLVT